MFVGIEMTGQSVEFEQKFNYRRPMYTVMDYLWTIEEHKKACKLVCLLRNLTEIKIYCFFLHIPGESVNMWIDFGFSLDY